MSITVTRYPELEALFNYNFFKTTTTIDSSQTTMSAADAPPGSPPATPFYATIDADVSGREIVKVTSVGSAPYQSWTIVRGQTGTSASAHAALSPVITTLSNGAGFMGGDGNVHCDLGDGRILFIFDDPIWATAAGQARTGFPSGHNVVAILTGHDETGTVTWYPSFFGSEGDEDGTPYFRWVGGACMLDGKLFIFGGKEGGTANPIKSDGWWCVFVDNPSDTPDNWIYWTLPLHNTDSQYLYLDFLNGVAVHNGNPSHGFSSKIDFGDGWIYTMGQDPRGFAMGRMDRAACKQLNWKNPQYWCGSGWAYEDELNSRVIAASNGDLRVRPDTQWEMWNISGGAIVQHALRSDQNGIFPATSDVYTIANSGGFCYAGSAVDEIAYSGKSGNDTTFIYTPGLGTLSQIAESYWPHFLKIQGL